MEIALVGLPQSGKTTVLDALTGGRAEVSARGSSRQDVHAGVAKMLDPRLDGLARIFEPREIVPVEIKYWDVPAGSGTAADGAGIGGQFLNLLQGADALLNVVRAFENPSVPHVRGGVDPHRDAANMASELAFSDLGILERRVGRIDSELKGAKGRERDSLLQEVALLQRLKEDLEREVPVREQTMSQEELATLSNYGLLTSKPLLVAFNVDEGAPPGTPALEEEPGRYQRPGMASMALCGKLEMELSQLSAEDETEFRASMGLEERGLDRVVRHSYELLSLLSFFTYVSQQVRAWTVTAGTPALKAAGKIHSDMERGFIRAEVVSFDDLARCGSMAQCKKDGLLRLEGKTYQVQDGDVITFLFNV